MCDYSPKSHISETEITTSASQPAHGLGQDERPARTAHATRTHTITKPKKPVVRQACESSDFHRLTQR